MTDLCPRAVLHCVVQDAFHSIRVHGMLLEVLVEQPQLYVMRVFTNQLSEHVSHSVLVTGMKLHVDFIGLLDFEMSNQIHFEHEHFADQSVLEFLIVLVAENQAFEFVDMPTVKRQQASVDSDEFQQNHRWPLDLREDFFQVGRALLEEKMLRGQFVPQC